MLEILKNAVEANASDILIIAGLPISFKLNGQICRVGENKLSPSDTRVMVESVYALAENRPMDRILEHGDDDFSFSIPRLARFRVNALKQRGSLGLIIRVVTFTLPDRREIGIPDRVIEFSSCTRGLLLIVGTAGSGKSTTLACIINEINTTRNAHIITVEDPIEYLHLHQKSVVTQREISTDTTSYSVALRAALRESPDVILLGEMRDAETIRAAVTAAETGHFVISTLHTMGAANTIDRVIDSFPPEQQQQIRTQLSNVLEGVVSQQLVPTVDGGLIPAFEIMTANSAIRNMIRESKSHQLDSTISSAGNGMISMDQSLLNLVQSGKISSKAALARAYKPEWLQKRLEL